MYVAALASIISAIATVAIAALTYRSSTHAQRSTEIARDTAQVARESVEATRESYIASERPWLKVSAELGNDLIWKGEDIELSIRFHLENFGTSPATGVFVECKIITLKSTGDQFSQARNEIHKSPLSTAFSARGAQLFPSEKMLQGWVAPLTKQQMDDSAGNAKRSGNLLPSFFVIGSVFYKSVFDEREHCTDFTFQVVALIDNAPDGFSNVPTFEESFPMERIVLRPALHFYPGKIT